MRNYVLFGIGVIALAVVLDLAVAWVFMQIWNYSVVSCLSVAKPIGYWQSFWLMIFAWLFLRSSRPGKND